MSIAYRHQKGLRLDRSFSPKAVRDTLSRGLKLEVAQLHQLSLLRRLGEMGFFIALYAGGVIAVNLSGGGMIGHIGGIILMGMALNACGLFIHEGLHGILVKGRRWNRIASFIVGIPLMISATAYRVTHTYHHFELGKRRDMGTYRQHCQKPILIWAAYIAQLIGGSLLYVLLVPVYAWKFGSRKSRLAMVLEYLLLACIFGVFFSMVPLGSVLTFWFYPLLVMNILTNVRGVASHALGDVENIYLSSRTITCSRLTAWLLLHENYHLEHHLFPKVPSYHLPKLHRLIWCRLPEAIHAHSYPHFLTNFFKAALQRDLRPMGVVRPVSSSTGEESC